MDLSRFVGKPLQEVWQEARNIAQSARGTARDALSLYRTLSKQSISDFSRGAIGQEIWQLEKTLGSHTLFMSQAGQDFFALRNFFQGDADGTFMEIGAYDGVTGSNSWYFEKVLGWQGVLIEASPLHCDEARRQRSSKVVCAACGNDSGEADFLLVKRGYTQMSGLIQGYPSARLEEVRSHPNHSEEIIRVPVRSMTSIAREHDLSQIDFCSIDVEGAELSILNNYDPDELPVRVFSIEVAVDGDTRIRRLMEDKGFRYVERIGFDEIFEFSL